MSAHTHTHRSARISSRAHTHTHVQRETKLVGFFRLCVVGPSISPFAMAVGGRVNPLTASLRSPPLLQRVLLHIVVYFGFFWPLQFVVAADAAVFFF